MANTQYILMKNKQIMYIKTYAVLCSILLIIFLVYFISSWKSYSVAMNRVENNKTLIAEFKANPAEKIEYEKNKTTFDQLRIELSDKLKNIFPADDNYTALTRNLDFYETKLATSNNVFEISSIDFQTPIKNEDYSILPLRMNIRSSEANFREFLHLMENSGALTEDVRLMEIASIKINFENNDKASASDVINFTVQINAYYQ